VKKHGRFSTNWLQTVETTMVGKSELSVRGTRQGLLTRIGPDGFVPVLGLSISSMAAEVVACVIRAGRGCLNGRG
jgi:hypothetical protein